MKVGDFGFGRSAAPTQLLNTFCGSINYAAPELLQGLSHYQAAYVDIWAFGVLLSFMVCGQLPFSADTPRGVKQKILRGAREVPDWVSTACASLIARILHQSPSDRPMMAQIRHDEWLAGQEFPRAFEEQGAPEAEVKHAMRHMGIPEEDMRQFRYYLRNPVGGTRAPQIYLS